jgi:hypothetical protein
MQRLGGEGILRGMSDSGIRRRQFLQLLVLSGAAVGCRRVIPTGDPTSPLPTAGAGVPNLHFELENNAISYGAAPSCDVTIIQGAATGPDGAFLPGLTVRLQAITGGPWQDAAQTGAGGDYQIEAAAELSEVTYRLQLVDQSGAPLSDVVVAQAIPSCDHNLMTVNFVVAE